MRRTLGEQLDEAVERNARLVVRLQHVMPIVHRHQPGHDQAVPWGQCDHRSCRKTVLILAGRYADARALGGPVDGRPATEERR